MAEVVWEHSHSKSGFLIHLRFDSPLVDDNTSLLPASTEGAAALTPVGRHRRALDPALAPPRRCGSLRVMCGNSQAILFGGVFGGRGRETALLGL